MFQKFPVILLKKLVIFPLQEIKIELNNDISKKTIDYCAKYMNGHVVALCPLDQLEEIPDVNDLPLIGVESEITSCIELPNGNYKIVLKGIKRLNIIDYVNLNEDNDILICNTTKIRLERIDEIDESAYIKKLKSIAKGYIKRSTHHSNGNVNFLNNITSLDALTDSLIPVLSLSFEKKIEYMLEVSPKNRAEMILRDLKIEISMLKLDEKMDDSLRNDLEKTQKEYLIKEKINYLKKELGEEDYKLADIKLFKEKLNNLKIETRIYNKFLNEIFMYETTSESSPNSANIRNYLDLVLNLPWNVSTVEEENINVIKNKLDSTHFALQNAKERILEYIAVKKRNGSLKSPIICLTGAPGVGKTTFGESIAESLGREFYKISVGGLNDVSELIGHRRTYLGSTPGKIIQAIYKCKSNNPVILIDEVDKMTNDYKGDPASCLLDILDPEQNYRFIDNFVEEPFNLRNVFFILTANDVSKIPDALKDRLEIIELSSYTLFDKVNIAKSYLLPKIYDAHKVTNNNIAFKDNILHEIINNYTTEAGVRELDRCLNKIVRKVVTEASLNDKNIKKTINLKDVEKYLCTKKHYPDIKLENKLGLVNALYWTPSGGGVHQIESIIYPGNPSVILTGSLGNIMKESVDVCISYIKSNDLKLKFDKSLFKNNTIHIHGLFTELSKNGPSAGVVICTSLLSLILKKEIDSSIAMTGELGLNGEVLPIGGLKEKLIGAYNRKMKKVFIPEKNSEDLKFVPDEVKNSLEIVLVKNYKEIYEMLFK